MQRSQATSARAILALLSIFLSPALAHGAQTADVPSKPNIIVVFTDDQGWADLSCQAAVADVDTPHIDRLAREGVRMEAGYVTAPQCVPSRAGLLSGRYQQRFGVDHNGQGPLPLAVETLPARLQKAGYVTGMVGKWHLEPNPSCSEWVAKNLPRAQPGRRRNLPIPAHKKAPYLPGPRGFSEFFFGHFSDYLANFDLEGMSLAPEGKQVRTGMYRLDAQSKAAVSFIRRNRDRPFFLYLAYTAPHWPLHALPGDIAKYEGKFMEGWDVLRRKRYERMVR
ncbi:MAG: sulfatase-like hydrolase/transferase, partial [Planctomycetes bacterium]|nr:sulfatase-like hydrolase/transferase [Planctomycetota bacterium]